MEKKKLLIVEDDVRLHQSLAEFLSSEGFEIASAYDGEQGIELAKTENPDLILLDIILPKKDGYAVIEAVRKDETIKTVPIVLLTNLGSLNDVEKALNLGATTYLVKADYKLEEITEKIKSVLEMA